MRRVVSIVVLWMAARFCWPDRPFLTYFVYRVFYTVVVDFGEGIDTSVAGLSCIEKGAEVS